MTCTGVRESSARTPPAQPPSAARCGSASYAHSISPRQSAQKLEAIFVSSGKPFIIGIGGTTRPNSSTEKALRVVLTHAEHLGCGTQLFGAGNLPLEIYDADVDERTPLARSLVAAMRAADGIVIASPGYHGSMSGLIKNALDFSEDMRADANVYFDGKAVGCIAVAAGSQALGSTVATIRSVVHSLRGWPTPYAAMINSTERPFDADGTAMSPAVLDALHTVAQQVVEFAWMRRLWVNSLPSA